jgi:predicted alpha/beta superfamily hydrolase
MNNQLLGCCLRVVVFITCVLPFYGDAHAAQQSGFELPRTQVVAIQDSGTKRKYELHIQLPKNYTAGQKYPVVYLTDSAYTFPITTGAARYPVNSKQMEHLLFVGISWQQGHPADLSRQRDYTPTANVAGYKDPSGEAQQHLQFIRNDVIPYIEQNFSTDPTRRTYIGNSFGGLFGVYVFLKQPTTFKNYIIGSPSVWWDNKYLLALESQTTLDKHLEANMFIAIGADEIAANLKYDMVGDAQQLYQRLKARKIAKLQLELRVIEHANHATAFPTTAVQGLWWLFKTEGSRGH